MRDLRTLVGVVFLLVTAGWFCTANAATLTPLWQFSGGVDGGEPVAALVQGTDSNFYGTTFAGGNNNSGVVFRITPSGTFTNLHLFVGHTDGAEPEAPLIQGFDGNFYGTTFSGGTNGMGVVFKMTQQGTVTTLWQFSGGADGGEPQAGLVQGSDSNFYGTSSMGGTNDAGTVFKISSGGAFTNLYKFSGGGDGGTPAAGLFRGSDGFFYGTTSLGGTNGGINGTLFKISSAGTLTTLYRFFGGADGSEPEAGLVQGSDSNFYGTTFIGGTNEAGVVFKITPAGTLTTLWQFSGGADGYAPAAGLIQGSDGLFYGTTSGGGTLGLGAAYRIGPTGTLTNLYDFTGGADGSGPEAGLFQGSDGFFYGTTYGGGTNSNGGVFKLTIASTPQPTLTQISKIQIVGTNVITTISAISNQTYQLQYSNSMTPTNWVNTGNATNGVSGSVQLIDSGGAVQPHRFYRIDISP